MRLKFLTAAAGLALFATDANAGIFRRKAAPACSAGQCQQSPQAAFPSPPAVAAGPAVSSAPACVNGVCGVQSVPVRRGLFGR